MTESRGPVPAPPERTASEHTASEHTASSPHHGDQLAPPLPLDITLHVPAETASVPLLRRLVHAALLGAGIDEDLVDDVTLATDEACTNVVLHGARTHGERFSYDVGLHITAERCVVTVAEREVGSLARAASTAPVAPELHGMADTGSEHGRGIALMSLLMDAVQLETDPTGSFRLLLEKGLQRAEAAVPGAAAQGDPRPAEPPPAAPEGGPVEPSAT